MRRSGSDPFGERDAGVLAKLARGSAASLANAIDFERERRIARALTRGFVPDSLPEVPGYDVGLLYEPAAKQPAGGDLYGAWRLSGGRVGMLVGDVAGKGVETAGLSAMARFFIEARSWDCANPAEILREASRMLVTRLPEDTFVTAFLAVIDGGEVRYANAGHLAPIVLRTEGSLEPAYSGALPLGINEDPWLADEALELQPGDLMFAFTDGLVEARENGELFGERRLSGAVARLADPELDMGGLVRAVHQHVREWAGALTDDVVALALRRR
jgi:serine phosphatase RsbU (regulator of sigma subunit)